MKIFKRKSFLKDFAHLRINEKRRVNLILEKFFRNPLDPILRNHKLAGRLKGMRAISIGGDLRIVFREHGGYIEVIFIAVGSHNQVY